MKQRIYLLLPVLSLGAAALLAALLPNSSKHPVAAHPYFTWLLLVGLVVYIILLLVNLPRAKGREKLTHHAPFLAGAVLFLNVLNLLTAKAAVLPVLYFPSLDRVVGTLFEDYQLIAKCVGYSAGILVAGVLGGAVVGFFMGTGVGFNKKMSYWLSPIIRVLGPMPSTAWIPLVLVAFPSARSASAFLIGLAVWFPTVVMTASGISNVRNAYFEVSSTLGANTFWRIFKVGVPAAMPHVFLGLFNGLCSSFITLMTAEMIGAKYGIGWYVNWQKEMMAYANVYAGLIVIAVLFCVIITLLFRFRDRVLTWQKGVIKW